MLTATVLALVAAALHAGWNLLIKTAGDRDLAAWGQFVFGGLALAPVFLFTGFPDLRSLPFLAYLHSVTGWVPRSVGCSSRNDSAAVVSSRQSW